MRKFSIAAISAIALVALVSCSPRDFLSRRLAADLIAGNDIFRSPQTFQMQIGILSNKDYLSAEYLALQHRGWISGVKAACPSDLAPPCLDVTLTPAGVDAFQNLVPPSQTDRQQFTFPAAKRQLIAITGIFKNGNEADIEFTWRWVALNEVGAALYPGDRHYRSSVAFRYYDEGWRVVASSARRGQPIEEALKNADPAP